VLLKLLLFYLVEVEAVVAVRLYVASFVWAMWVCLDT